MLVAILGAVSSEIQGLVQALNPPESFRFLGELFHVLQWGPTSVALGTTGLGKVNGATVTSALLQRFPMDQVWNVGCSGAYREGPLNKGDVLVSSEIFLGDEGVLTSGGILSTREIGIPVLKVGQVPLFESIPLERQAVFGRWLETTPQGTYEPDGLFAPSTVAERGCAGQQPPFRLVHGPSLTVSLVSGDEETAARRHRQYGAFAENMEGSGIAQACFRHGVPMMECRGVSNLAGDRDKNNWDFEQAFAHCHTIVLKWLESLALFVNDPKEL